jgi:hypothetical protein
MKRTSLAGLLLAGVSAAALAQQPPADIPKHKCEPKPVLPGPRMMEEPSVRKRFQRDVETYKNCMKSYADERAAAARAQTEAGNAAITEYNETMKALQDAQKSN